MPMETVTPHDGSREAHDVAAEAAQAIRAAPDG